MARVVHLPLACVLLLGCGEAESEEPVECTDETALASGAVDSVVRLFDFPPGNMCGGNIEAIDSHAAWVASRWGAPPPLVEYNLYDSSQHSCWPCPSFASACAGDGVLNTTRVPDRHELAHASHGPTCSALLEEGWATLYANPFEDAVVFGTFIEAIASIEGNGYLAGDYYPLAAKFVAYVIDTWGMDTVVELCAHRLSTWAEFEAAAEEVFGMTPLELHSDLEAYGAWSLGQLRQDRACEEGTEPHVAPASLTLGLGCDGANVEGRKNVRTWTHALVELPEPGNYAFSFNSEVDLEVEVELRSCAREGMASIEYEQASVAISSEVPVAIQGLQLVAGVYVVRVMADADDFGAGPNPMVELTVSPGS